MEEIQNCAGRSVKFAVFSYKGQQLREIFVSLPPLSEQTPKAELGLALQWAPLALSSLVFHVLDVKSSSPAFRAGLAADSDYIVGIEGYKMLSESALGDALEENLNKDLTLQVYNHDYNVVRLATIVPERDWGGDGVLGCGIGFGYLHRIPEFNSAVPVPGETIFSADDDDEANEQPQEQTTTATGVPATQTEMLLKQMHITDAPEPPADKPSSPPPPPSDSSSRVPPSPSEIAMPSYMRRKHHKPNAGAAHQLDAYFDEQEKISKEADVHAPNSGKASAPPPPPKDSEIRRKSSTDEPEKPAEAEEEEDEVE